MPTYDYAVRWLRPRLRIVSRHHRSDEEEVPQMRQAKAAAFVRHRGGDRFQGIRAFTKPTIAAIRTKAQGRPTSRPANRRAGTASRRRARARRAIRALPAAGARPATRDRRNLSPATNFCSLRVWWRRRWPWKVLSDLQHGLRIRRIAGYAILRPVRLSTDRFGPMASTRVMGCAVK